MSSPRSDTGQVFATVSAISMSASQSECIMVIPEAGNWLLSISRNAFLLWLCRRKSPFLRVDGLWRDGTIFLPSLSLLRSICVLPLKPSSIHQIRLLCFELFHSCSANSVWRIDIFHQTCFQQSVEVFATMTYIKNIIGILKYIRHIYSESPN